MPANLARLEQATSLAQSAEAFGVYMSYEQLEARRGEQAREAALGKQEQRDRDRREIEREEEVGGRRRLWETEVGACLLVILVMR